MILGPDGAQRDEEPNMLGIPLGAHAAFGALAPFRRRGQQPSLPFRRAFRTRTRIPAVDTVEFRTTAPPRRSRSAATPRLPMRPHLRWVCVQNAVKDRNPLRDEGNRWGKPSSAICRRPWGASATKIDAIFPCNSYWLLLKSAHRRQPRHPFRNPSVGLCL